MHRACGRVRGRLVPRQRTVTRHPDDNRVAAEAPSPSRYGRDYVDVVIDDLFDMGKRAADALAAAVGRRARSATSSVTPTRVEVVLQDLALAHAQPVHMNVFLGGELVKGPLRRLDRDAMAAHRDAARRALRAHPTAPRSRSGTCPAASAKAS